MAAGPSPSFWSGKSVLVTGHTGFIGSWLTTSLVHLGANVSGISLEAEKPSLYDILSPELSIDSHIANIHDAGSLSAIVGRIQPEIVFHLAAESLVHRAHKHPAASFMTNVMGTVHVLEALRSMEMFKAAVLMTTDKVYLNQESQRAFREDDKLGGKEPYGASKACADIAIDAYRSSYFSDNDKGIACVRAGNVIGGGDFSPNRLIPDYVRAAMAGESLHLRHPGACRPWQFVMEPVRACLMLAEATHSAPAQFSEAWNVGPLADDILPVHKVITQMQSIWGKSAPPVTHADSAGGIYEAQFLSIDSSKFNSRLNWRPAKPFTRGLEATTEWYKAYMDGINVAEMTFEHVEEWLDTK